MILVTQNGLGLTHTAFCYLEVKDALKPRYKALNYIGFIANAVDQAQALRARGSTVQVDDSMAHKGVR